MIKIGKVSIDDSLYAGHDLYSDGPIEDVMLEIARTVTKEEMNSEIANRKDWAILYHFSHLRENIILSLPLSKNDKVLEIGAGCGAITGALADLTGSVHAIDLSMKRSQINAHRHKDKDNLMISVGNFEDIEKTLTEKYDLITLIGVFEYGQAYISTNNPYVDFLKKIKRHLKENGKVVIAIENKYGLKYYAGCKEDHIIRYFEGIEGYPNASHVRTFGKDELTDIIEEAGLVVAEFYYPYPDYKFPLKIFSDDFLPSSKELNINYLNFDNERIKLFNETLAFQEVIKDKLFPLFSNSFLVIVEGETDA